MHNRIKDQLAAGKPAFGTQLRFGSPAIAELCGHSGFDFLVIDSQHAPQTPPGIQAQLQAIGNTPATPIVRLPRIDEEQIRLYLDMGALGILAPFVNTAAQAAEGARAVIGEALREGGAENAGAARDEDYLVLESEISHGKILLPLSRPELRHGP
jgi:4-hydroxy-2-oxoheptanedioate aldolase